MNESYETYIKHGYNLMVRQVREARDANFKSRGRIYTTRGPGGAQYWGPQGLDFLTMLAPGAGPAKYQVMHSGNK